MGSALSVAAYRRQHNFKITLRVFSLLFVVGLHIVFLVPSESFAQESASIQIIFDASGSMNNSLEGESKLQIAKKALKHFMDTSVLSRQTRWSLRVFGLESEHNRSELSCSNSELIVDFAKGDKQSILDAVASIQAHGKTAIARSLKMAGKDLRPFQEFSPTILLLTDGRETCGGNPIKEIDLLRRQGMEVSMHVIGLDVNNADRIELKKIARAANGSYADANNYESLNQSLSQFAEKTKQRIRQRKSKRSLRKLRLVQGGPTHQSAEILGSGKYEILGKMPTGQKFFFVASTSEAEAMIFRSATKASFQLDRYDKHGRKIIQSSRQIGSKDSSQVYVALDQTGEGVFFSLSDAYGFGVEDLSFAIDIIPIGDVRPGNDAPNHFGINSPFLDANIVVRGFVGIDDSVDSYRFKLQDDLVGKKILIQFIDPDFAFKISVWNLSQNRKISDIRTSGGYEFLLKKDVFNLVDEFGLKIHSANPSYKNRHSAYTVEFVSKKRD